MAQKDKNREIDIMGIVNITDNSYFAESRCLADSGKPDLTKTLRRVESMLLEGATIIDIGACSTRPGSEPVGETEEWTRLKPVLSAVRNEFPEVRISVDTYWSSVVENTFDLIGDFIVNDISAGEDDVQMLPTVGKLGLEYVAMHKRGNSRTMQDLCRYGDIVNEIKAYFTAFEAKAESFGIDRWILDPGFGFAKDIAGNYTLMSNLDRLCDRGDRKILVGISRKSMIFKLFDITPEEALPQTQVLHLAALQKGADILRVHDVAEAARTVAIYKML